jgi:DNA repair exonuclease SbcCD ATPase subunit
MRKLYFGGKPLHAFIRPILGGQLAAMQSSGDLLAKSGHKALEAIGQDLAPLLPKADAAVTAEVQAIAKRDEFRTVGARKAFIDDVNAARKKTYSEASTIQQNSPELTSDIIEGLFLRDRSRDEDPTEEGLQDEIEDLEAQLADRKKLLAQLQKQREEAMAQQKYAEAEEKKKRLAQLQKELEDKQKEAAALVAELESP